MTHLQVGCKYSFLLFLFLAVSCSVLPSDQIPSPTLSSTQIANIVTELYIDNGGCKLPCLLGIVPGQTSIPEVYNQLSDLGDFGDQTRTVDNYQNIAFTPKAPPDGVISSLNTKWGFSMRVKNDIVVGLVTGANDIQIFSTPSLSDFLAYFGRPEEMWFRVIESQLIEENPDYEIALFYPSKGVSVRWRGGVNTILSQTEKGITLTACPQKLPLESDTVKGFYPPFFYLFTPNEKTTFGEIIKTHLSEDPSGSYQPISIADLRRFYTMYLDLTTQDCFLLSYTW